MRAASVLYQQGAKGIQGWIDKTNDTGYAAETAAKRLDNLKGDLEALSGSLETALIGVGDGAQGPLRNLVQGLTNVINAYNKLGDGAKSATGAFLAVTAAAGGGLFAFVKITKAIAATRVALDAVGISADRARGALTTLGKGGIVLGVAAAAVELQKALEGAANVNLSNLARDLEGFARSGKASGELIKAFGNDLDGVSKRFRRDGESLGEMLAYTANNVDSLVEKFEGYDQSLPVQRTKELDTALGELAQSNLPAAKEAFSRLVAIAKEQGVSVAKLKRVFPEYTAELARAATASTSTSAAQKKLSAAAKGVAAASRAEAKAMQEARSAATKQAQSFVGLGKSLNDGKVSLKSWIKEMAKSAQDLRNFTKNTQTAADKGLRQGLIDALREAGPEGARRMKQLANATDAEIRKANRAWGSGQRAVNRYTDTVTRVPNSKTTKIRVDGADFAVAQANRVRDAIARVQSKSVTITTIERRRASGNSVNLPVARASGGTIPGERYPYSDKVLTYLAPGEEVISNRYGQADRHRALLKAINGNRYAAGGTVGQRTQAGPSIDYDRLAGAVGNGGTSHQWNVSHAVDVNQLAFEVARVMAVRGAV